MKRKILLHGRLKKLCPDGLEIDAATVAEAIRGLCAVTNGAFNPIPGKGRHEISVVGFPTRESLYEPIPDEVTELHLMPTFAGGKRGGVMQVIIGVVIIVAAVVAALPSGGTSLALGTSVLWGMTTAGGLMFAGVMMAAGGLLAMMSPAPKMDTGVGSTSYSGSSNPEASKYLGAPQNTVKIGTRIPILYGRTRVYGHILSLGIQATDVAV
jgi:predicted phage tail protein